MKKLRFTESQYFKKAEAGTTVTELCRKDGMSDDSFDKWPAKYGSIDVSIIMTRMKELEEENRRLKKMYAESKMDA